MIGVMRRPRWVLSLLLALAIAALFAILGQWQLARAIESGEVVQRSTEKVLPLADVAKPDGPVSQVATGQMVTLRGSFVPGDDQIISERFNGGDRGFWVVGHFVTDAHASIAVARGWTPDEKSARDAVEGLAVATAEFAPETLTGRLVPAEAPELPDEDGASSVQTTVSPAALINLWSNFEDQSVYSVYVVDSHASAGLARIDSPVPDVDKELNWLNIFYAIEWVVFAGFAVFLWYRLVRDTWERELEEAAERSGDGT